MPWNDYKQSLIWKKAMVLVEEVYSLIPQLPPEEKFALSSQMRRAVVSVPSNIAEGNSRFSPKEFRRFLEVAKGSLYELDTQILICEQQNYLTPTQTKKTKALTDELNRMITKLIVKLNEESD